MYKTQNTKVHVIINGELKECALVFTNNGSDFCLENSRSIPLGLQPSGWIRQN